MVLLVYVRLLKSGLSCIKTQDISQNNKESNKKMTNQQKEVQTKLTKGLLDLIILQFLNSKPVHGYEIITKIRKNFGVYFGPSTIYPLLTTLEKKKLIQSKWDMSSERPRKVYELTNEGHSMLTFTENSLNLLRQQISTQRSSVTIEAIHSTSERKHLIAN